MGMGGAETVTLTLAQEFIKQGHSVDLFVVDDIIKLDVDKEINLHILGFKKRNFAYKIYAAKLHQMIHETGYFDGVYVHLQKSARLMKNFKHPHLYFVIHSTLSQASLSGRHGLKLYLKKRFLHKIYNGLNLITVSKGIEEDILNTTGIKPKSIQTIYNPLNFEQVRNLAKEKIDLDFGEYIIHVGRLASSKRHDRLLRAFSASSTKYNLLLIGEGDMRTSIEKQIVELGLNDRVKLLGFNSNPYPYIKCAKLLVLSSDYEGLPTVLIEALVLGTNVVSTNCPSGPKEILSNGLEDNLVRLNDINDLALKMAGQSQKNLKPMVQNRSIQYFESEYIAKKYLFILKLK